MLDLQLQTLIKTILVDGFIALNITVEVDQNYQPTQQGANIDPTIYFFDVGPDKRYGFTEKKDVWIPATPPDTGGLMQHTESQWMESMYQFSALATQNPADLNALTAKDLLNYAAYILNSDVSQATLQSNGVGMERITQIRSVPFVNEKGLYQKNPSFDVVFTHQQIITTTVPIVTSTEYQIHRV